MVVGSTDSHHNMHDHSCWFPHEPDRTDGFQCACCAPRQTHTRSLSRFQGATNLICQRKKTNEKNSAGRNALVPEREGKTKGVAVVMACAVSSVLAHSTPRAVQKDAHRTLEPQRTWMRWPLREEIMQKWSSNWDMSICNSIFLRMESTTSQIETK